MNSLDGLFTAWCSVGWLWLLVFTASVLAVGALRRPCRKFFGAERAFLLWLLPLPSLLATLLPHVTKPASPLPPIIVAITTLPGGATASMPGVDGMDWRGWGALLWLTGAIAVLLIAVYAQLRYQAKLRGAVGYGDISSRWPILRATEPSTGPALVGALRPRIVVPSDFDNRFDGNERAMILAHEGMHARRGDSYWNLLAMMVVGIFWFHPLAWWALSAFRRDQELACDAGVLRSQKGKRRCYANAMLKTQSAVSLLPVGCAWSPGHPLTERIAMLKQPLPNRARRIGGLTTTIVLAVLATGGVYAASVPTSSTTVNQSRYGLKLTLAVDGQAPTLHAHICLKPGEPYSVTRGGIDKLPPWHGRFYVSPALGGMLEVRAAMDGGPMEKPASSRVRILSGQTATIKIGGQSPKKSVDSSRGNIIKINLTPKISC